MAAKVRCSAARVRWVSETIDLRGRNFLAEKDFEAALTQAAIYVKPMEVMEFVPKVGK